MERQHNSQLRVYLLLKDLQPQFAAYLGTPIRARGYPALAGEHSLLIETSPALAIHRITDLALKAAPDMEPGILFTERQFGLLELHSGDADELVSAGKAILDGTGMVSSSAMKPEILFQDIIQDIADQHAILLNRNRSASMVVPGQSLLLIEMVPALFACLAANEAEKVSPAITLVDVQMMGASGRVFIAGRGDELETCLSAIESALN